MKQLIFLASAIVIATSGFAQKGKKNTKQDVAPAKFVLANEVDSVSYGIGLNIAQSITKDFKEANLDALFAGMKEGVDSSSKVSVEEFQNLVAFFFKRKQDAASNVRLAEAKKIMAEGQAFLAENKSKQGVITTQSGLQYIVLKEGNGKKPFDSSSVTVHYVGTTPDGTIFDSSINRGEPATFGLNQVIKGWTEGLQLMKEGAKYKFFLPQELAYGSNPPPGGIIKAFMPLIFEVELIKVND